MGSPTDGLMGATIGFIGDQYTAGQNMSYADRQGKKQYQRQRKLNEQGQQLGMKTWNETNYEAQVEHLKNAGLSTGLMYGGSGAGGATVSAPSGGSAPSVSARAESGGLNAGIGAMSQLGMMKTQQELLKAQKDNVEANTNKTNVETANIEEPITASVKKTGAEADKLKIETDFLTNTLDDRQLQEQAKAVGGFIENINKETDTNVKEAQIEKMAQDVAQGWEKLDQGKQEIAIKKFEAELKALYPKLGEVMGGEVNQLVQKLRLILQVKDGAKKVNPNDQYK